MVRWIVGVDEVGRGPLAGPVTVCAFAVPESFAMARLHGVRDSKQLSARVRTSLEVRLRNEPSVRIAVASTSARMIDESGITRAIASASRRALARLGLEPQACQVMLDGSLTAPKEYQNQETLVHGDALVPVISAASIVAKVARDRLMDRYATMYPEYGFEVHKGYGTAQHRAALTEHGLCAIHRRSFCTRIERVHV